MSPGKLPPDNLGRTRTLDSFPLPPDNSPGGGGGKVAVSKEQNVNEGGSNKGFGGGHGDRGRMYYILDGRSRTTHLRPPPAFAPASAVPPAAPPPAWGPIGRTGAVSCAEPMERVGAPCHRDDKLIICMIPLYVIVAD